MAHFGMSLSFLSSLASSRSSRNFLMLLDFIPLLIPIIAKEARTEAKIIPNGEPNKKNSPMSPRKPTRKTKTTITMKSCPRLNDPNLRSSSIWSLAYSSSLVSNPESSSASSSSNYEQAPRLSFLTCLTDLTGVRHVAY